MLEAGDTVGGYQIVRELNRGGQAIVFLARATHTGAVASGTSVALKVIHPHLARQSEFARMLADEAHAARRVVHPNVVRVHALGHDRGQAFLVMELVDGCSLAELLRDGGRLSLAAIAAVAAPLADGLHAVHEATEEDGTPLGIVHRDVSPQNVLVDRAGSVKLIDFGVSKLSAGQQSTVTGFLKGKLRYMPPEQAHGRRLDRRADVYAFGIVLWELLTGRVLFDADNEFELLDQVRAAQAPAPSSIAPGLPASLDAIVARALAADPDARFATMAELRDELARALPRPDARALAARVVEVANRDREPTEEPATALASPVALAARRSSRARVVALSSAAAIAALVGLWATIRTSPRPAVATEPAPAPVVAVPPPAPAVAPVPAPPPVARRPATRPPRARSAPPAPERVKSRSPYPLVDDPF